MIWDWLIFPMTRWSIILSQIIYLYYSIILKNVITVFYTFYTTFNSTYSLCLFMIRCCLAYLRSFLRLTRRSLACNLRTWDFDWRTTLRLYVRLIRSMSFPSFSVLRRIMFLNVCLLQSWKMLFMAAWCRSCIPFNLTIISAFLSVTTLMAVVASILSGTLYRVHVCDSRRWELSIIELNWRNSRVFHFCRHVSCRPVSTAPISS